MSLFVIFLVVCLSVVFFLIVLILVVEVFFWLVYLVFDKWNGVERNILCCLVFMCLFLWLFKIIKIILCYKN